MRSLLILLLSSTLAAAATAKPPPKKPAAPLDQLFAQLAKAENAEEAKPIEEQILAIFRQSGSATADLLMARGTAAHESGDDKTARKLFDSLTDVAPNYAEGWHAKALLDADAGDDESAMFALQTTVTLNPREFTALDQLAQMVEGYGNKEGALKLYKRALALDPQLEGVAKHVTALEREVEGQGI